MSNDIKTRLAKEILDFKWTGPTTDVMRGWNLALDFLVKYKLTNDIEKVVRCKDCKYGDTGTDEIGRRFYKCIGIHYGGVSPTDYCSYGVRKDD